MYLKQHLLHLYLIFFVSSVSPSAKIATWRYWFRLYSDVYGGNRSFASYTKTKTMESAVWCLLTRLDDGDSQQVTRSKYLNTVLIRVAYGSRSSKIIWILTDPDPQHWLLERFPWPSRYTLVWCSGSFLGRTIKARIGRGGGTLPTGSGLFQPRGQALPTGARWDESLDNQ